MTISTQEDLLYLSSAFSKLLKRSFGKGPETCYVIFRNNRLYVYLRNFITPAEEVLVEQNKINLATSFRCEVINAVTKQFLPEVSKVLGMKVDYFFHDWNYNSNTGILLLEDASSDNKNDVKIDPSIQENLFKVIRKVSSHLHKVPISIEIVKFTSNICAVECKGALLNLEKHLYEKKKADLLLQHSREIKNGYLQYKGLFEDVFNRGIVDFFVMWDYENNRKYLIFNFNKEY